MRRHSVLLDCCVAALLATTIPAHAEEFDREEVVRGMKLYQLDAADCEYCHAWNGKGKNQDLLYSPVPAGGPSLVASTLDRAGLIMIISCGRLSAEIMPQFRGDAWTPAYPCWGKLKADLPPEERPLVSRRQMTPREIEALVTYIQAMYQGKEMTLEGCHMYFGDYQRACEAWQAEGIVR